MIKAKKVINNLKSLQKLWNFLPNRTTMMMLI